MSFFVANKHELKSLIVSLVIVFSHSGVSVDISLSFIII